MNKKKITLLILFISISFVYIYYRSQLYFSNPLRYIKQSDKDNVWSNLLAYSEYLNESDFNILLDSLISLNNSDAESLDAALRYINTRQLCEFHQDLILKQQQIDTIYSINTTVRVDINDCISTLEKVCLKDP